MCWQRDAGDDGVVPSCTGDANTLGSGAEDYCAIRPSPTYLSSVYDHFAVSNEGTFPIGLCSGDCDLGKRDSRPYEYISFVWFLNVRAVLKPIDTDCEGDLVCYSRSNFDPVPGCQGEGEESFDYCVPPDTPDKVLEFLGDEANNYYSLKACQGGTDHKDVFRSCLCRWLISNSCFLTIKTAISILIVISGLHASNVALETMALFQDVLETPTTSPQVAKTSA